MFPPSEAPQSLVSADLALRRGGTIAGDVAWTLLEAVQDDAASTAPVAALKRQAGLETDEVERLLLWHAARQAMPLIASLPVDRAVRERLDRDLPQLHSMKASLVAGGYLFKRAAKMATLRRFPAGPMEWEVSGIPRSWLLQADFPANLRFLAFVLLRLGGFAPCFFMHVAPAPRNRALSVPKEVLRAYYRMARSLELQPRMRALLAHAWFHDPAAVRDQPQLEILSRPYLDHGGLIVTLGPAPATSGVGEGNAQRQADYLAGKLKYRYGFAIWPRDAAVSWANAHPELAD